MNPVNHFVFSSLLSLKLLLFVVLLSVGGFSSAAGAAKAQPPSEQSQAARSASVNINTADAPTLAAGLKGVGLKRAKAIIAYREKSGGFKQIEELLAIKGIGTKLLERNRAKIVL